MARYGLTIQKKFLALILLVGLIPAALGMILVVWGARLAFASAMAGALETRALELASAIDQACEEQQSALAEIVRASAGDFEAICKKAGALQSVDAAILFQPPSDLQIVTLDLRKKNFQDRILKLGPYFERLAASRQAIPEGYFDDIPFNPSNPAEHGGWILAVYPSGDALVGFLSRADVFVQRVRSSHANEGDATQLYSRQGFLLSTAASPEGLLDWIDLQFHPSGGELSAVGDLWREEAGHGSWHLVAYAASRRMARLSSEGHGGAPWAAIVSYDMEQFLAPQLAYLWPRMIAVSAVWVVVLVILAAAAARRIVWPVKSLRKQAEAMAAGNLDARAKVRTHDEIQDLAEAFNRMAEQLRERDRRIKNFTQELEAKVEERTRDLARANQKLIQTEKHSATGRLAANLAHEINNPLGIIKNFMRLVTDAMTAYGGGRRKSDPNLERMQIIGEEIDRIARIVRQLLDLHRPADQSVKDTDINLLLQSILTLMDKGLSKDKIEIKSQLAPDLPRIVVAPDQMRQVFLNLLRNAQDAMEGKGGTLTVKTEQRETVEDGSRERALVVSVSDTGSGISEENLGQIFDPFFSTKGPEKGTGLGLSVSYGIVQHYGGSIEAVSEIGKGTTMIVTLPYKKHRLLAHPDAAPAAPATAP